MARFSGLRLGLCASATLVGASAQTPAPALRGPDVTLAGAAAADALPELAPPDNAAEPPPRKKTTLRVLPPLQPYPRAERIGLRGGPSPDAGRRTPGPTVAAEPVPPPRRIVKRENQPFEPVGLFVGDLKLTPYFEQDAGYASNPYGAPRGAKGSALSTSEAGVALQSDWSRNSLSGAAKLGYNEYFQAPGASAPYGSGVIDYRHDVSHDLTLDTEGRYNLTTETNAQLGLSGASTNTLAQVATYGATLGGDNRFGDLSLGLHGTVDRVQYSGGGLNTDDYTDYGVKLRGAYRVTEAWQPFAEIDADTRAYDASVDATGYNRASDGLAGKVGARFAPSALLTAEVSAGYGVRDYRDARLPNVGAPLFDASLAWAVTPLTTLTFKASTQIADAVVAGASGDINRAYTINLDHGLTERIKLGLNAGIATDRYVGIAETDHSYTLGATAEYRLSRDLALKASATHQQFVSSVPGANYAADTVLLGVRLQR